MINDWTLMNLDENYFLYISRVVKRFSYFKIEYIIVIFIIKRLNRVDFGRLRIKETISND